MEDVNEPILKCDICFTREISQSKGSVRFDDGTRYTNCIREVDSVQVVFGTIYVMYLSYVWEASDSIF